MSNLEDRLREIRSHIPSGVCLIAVSKGQSADDIAELYRLGHRDFGENYVQELVEKATDLSARGCSEIRWHFIGHLQSNKVKALLPWVSSVHTVDSEKLAQELQKRWLALERTKRLPVFLEVNIDQEASKSGIMPALVAEQARAIASSCPSLDLQGLMCVPARGSDAGAFTRLRELERTCRPQTQAKLSMGMSGDYLVAIREGATHIRVGTALFGSRKPKV